MITTFCSDDVRHANIFLFRATLLAFTFDCDESKRLDIVEFVTFIDVDCTRRFHHRTLHPDKFLRVKEVKIGSDRSWTA